MVKTEVRFALRKLGLKLKYTDADLRGIVASMMRNADAKIRGGLGERAIRFMVGDSFKETPEDFVRMPDGSIDLGYIRDDVAKAIGFPAGAIRLQKGNELWGETKIEAKHGDAIRKYGFTDTADFVRYVSNNYNSIHEGDNGRVLLAVRNGKDMIASVELKKEGGGYYSVTTAFPSKLGYLNARKRIWSGAAKASTTEPGSSDSRSIPASVKSGKEGLGASSPNVSSESNILPSGEDDKPRFSLKDLRETAEDIQKTLKTIVTPVKGHEGDAGGFLAQTLASPEWIDHDGIQKIVQHNLERVETKHEIHYELTTDDNGESIIGKLDRMKKDKKTRVQYSILSAVTTWADEKKWNAMPVDKIMERTERELKDRGAKPETIALWRMIQPMVELRDEIRAKVQIIVQAHNFMKPSFHIPDLAKADYYFTLRRHRQSDKIFPFVLEGFSWRG